MVTKIWKEGRKQEERGKEGNGRGREEERGKEGKGRRERKGGREEGMLEGDEWLNQVSET